MLHLQDCSVSVWRPMASWLRWCKHCESLGSQWERLMKLRKHEGEDQAKKKYKPRNPGQGTKLAKDVCLRQYFCILIFPWKYRSICIHRKTQISSILNYFFCRGFLLIWSHSHHKTFTFFSFSLEVRGVFLTKLMVYLSFSFKFLNLFACLLKYEGWEEVWIYYFSSFKDIIHWKIYGFPHFSWFLILFLNLWLYSWRQSFSNLGTFRVTIILLSSDIRSPFMFLWICFSHFYTHILGNKAQGKTRIDLK